MTTNTTGIESVKLTAADRPKRVEAWPICPCCGDVGFFVAEKPGKFDKGKSWPVKHTFEGYETVFEDAEQVKRYVRRAVNLMGNHPQNGIADAEGNQVEMVDLEKLMVFLIEGREQDMKQLLHCVGEFDGMLTELFGEREETREDAIVWAFAYIMNLVCNGDYQGTINLLHETWRDVYFRQ